MGKCYSLLHENAPPTIPISLIFPKECNGHIPNLLLDIEWAITDHSCLKNYSW